MKPITSRVQVPTNNNKLWEMSTTTIIFLHIMSYHLILLIIFLGNPKNVSLYLSFITQQYINKIEILYHST